MKQAEEEAENDHIGAYAQAFFIANLLFVGVFYLALWLLYFLRYKQASAVSQQHIRQSLFASSISTGIFAIINIVILRTDGYASLTALLSLEVYFMFIVPLFLIVGLLGFVKAVQDLAFNYPLFGKFTK